MEAGTSLSELAETCLRITEPLELCGLLQACSELISLPQTLFASLATLIGVGSVCPLCGCVVIPLGTVVTLCGYFIFGLPSMGISLVSTVCSLPRNLIQAFGELVIALPEVCEAVSSIGGGGGGEGLCSACPCAAR